MRLRDRKYSNGCVGKTQRQRLCNLFTQRRLRLFWIERPRPGQKEFRIQSSRIQIRIGHCRIHAAQSIAGRARHRAGAPGSNPESGATFDPGHGSASRSDRNHVERGDEQRMAAHFAALSHLRGAVSDQRHIGARTPHIQSDNVPDATLRSERGCTDDSTHHARVCNRCGKV